MLNIMLALSRGVFRTGFFLLGLMLAACSSTPSASAPTSIPVAAATAAKPPATPAAAAAQAAIAQPTAVTPLDEAYAKLYPAAKANAATFAQINPLTGVVTPDALQVIGNYSVSEYHSLQAKFQRQFSRGLGGVVSYTWSHSTDDSSGNLAPATPVLPTAAQAASGQPLSLLRGASDFDVRHVLSLSVVYETPNPSNTIARAVLGHWALAPIYHYQSASPLDLTTGVTSYDDGGQPAHARLLRADLRDRRNVRGAVRPGRLSRRPGAEHRHGDFDYGDGSGLHHDWFTRDGYHTVRCHECERERCLLHAGGDQRNGQLRQPRP